VPCHDQSHCCWTSSAGDLERLTAEYGGDIEPIDDATPAAGPGSPLYERYECDDAKAAATYREMLRAQAGYKVVQVQYVEDLDAD
jgi:hypothetical protein